MQYAEQLVFLYKSTAPSPAPTVLIHNAPADQKEINEHQLAPVGRHDKKNPNNKDKPKQFNNNEPNHGQNQSYQHGQGNYRPQRGRYQQQGGTFRGRPTSQNDQRYNTRGRGYPGRGRGYDNSYNNYNRGRGRPFQCRPWRSWGFQPRGRGYMPQAGTGDPEYRHIPQYRYICGVCCNKGHYDHQCHTLQHLAHAIQSQQAQNYSGPGISPETENSQDQPTF